MRDHEDIPIYVVEDIIGKRYVGRGPSKTLQYLVLWQGYPRSEATWEPLAHLHQVTDIIQAYEDSLLKTPAPVVSTPVPPVPLPAPPVPVRRSPRFT